MSSGGQIETRWTLKTQVFEIAKLITSSLHDLKTKWGSEVTENANYVPGLVSKTTIEKHKDSRLVIQNDVIKNGKDHEAYSF